MKEDHRAAPWLLLMFTLSSKRASERVGIWRKLKKYGALALRTSGYLLPNKPENQERFEWLAEAIRDYKGRASVAQVQAIDDMPTEKLVHMFIHARTKEYEMLARELKSLAHRSKHAPPNLARLRRRFQEIAAIDFFNSPLRSRVEALIESADSVRRSKVGRHSVQGSKRQYHNRIWMTRPRPGIDRVSSAWLITRYIDPNARFIFGNDPDEHPEAVPFDMFQAVGFGHRGEDCSFETLRKEFAIRDRRVRIIAEMVHDADLLDEKFGRTEGLGLDRVLVGWAHEAMPDEELLRRGTQLVDGLYHSVS